MKKLDFILFIFFAAATEAAVVKVKKEMMIPANRELKLKQLVRYTMLLRIFGHYLGTFIRMI